MLCLRSRLEKLFAIISSIFLHNMQCGKCGLLLTTWLWTGMWHASTVDLGSGTDNRSHGLNTISILSVLSNKRGFVPASRVRRHAAGAVCFPYMTLFFYFSLTFELHTTFTAFTFITCFQRLHGSTDFISQLATSQVPISSLSHLGPPLRQHHHGSDRLLSLNPLNQRTITLLTTCPYQLSP